MISGPVWRQYLLISAVIAACYFVVPWDAVQAIGGTLLQAGAAVVIVAAVRRRRPAVRWPWYALAGKVALFAAGDAAYWMYTVLWHRDAFPSPADAFYVPSNLLLVAALIGFVRARRTGLDRAGLLDAAILSTGAGLLAWIYVIEPVAGLGDVSALGRGVSLAYPVLDVLALAVLLRLTVDAGHRPPAYRLLVTAVTLLLVTEITYLLLELAGVYQVGGLLDLGWMATHVLMGAAALHPTMTAVSTAVPPAPAEVISRTRLTALAAASLMAPAVLTAEWLRDEALDVPVVVAACVTLFLLVLTRLHDVVALLADALDTARVQAGTDLLTGLANRRQFHTRWEHALTTGPTALLYVDLDGFKAVNDTHGHEGGDAVLEAVAARIRDTVRAGDVVARLGGDEFAVILPGATDAHAGAVAARIAEAVARPIAVDGVPVTVGASIGIISAPHGADPEAEIKRADTAMYAAKAAGRDHIRPA